MSIVHQGLPLQPARTIPPIPSPSPIPPAEAAKALRFAQALRLRQWRAEQYRLDLAEYQDAALDALTACLGRYNPTLGIPLATYAYPRIKGAVRRAWLRYRTWRELRGGRWFHSPPDADTLRPARPDPRARIEYPQRGLRDAAFEALVALLRQAKIALEEEEC